MNNIELCTVRNNLDKDGNPQGGHVLGVGLDIRWQNGPLGRGEDRKEPNGAFVETVISAAVQRLEHYQSTKFNCQENAEAIHHLQNALLVLENRTASREDQGVEGTHETRPTEGGEIDDRQST